MGRGGIRGNSLCLYNYFKIKDMLARLKKLVTKAHILM